jgi:hypothetical protein
LAPTLNPTRSRPSTSVACVGAGHTVELVELVELVERGVGRDDWWSSR